MRGRGRRAVTSRGPVSNSGFLSVEHARGTTKNPVAVHTWNLIDLDLAKGPWAADVVYELAAHYTGHA